MSSVRAKTTAFLGKMLGASSTRERSVSVLPPMIVILMLECRVANGDISSDEPIIVYGTPHL